MTPFLYQRFHVGRQWGTEVHLLACRGVDEA
jgi:hypothetical protein